MVSADDRRRRRLRKCAASLGTAVFSGMIGVTLFGIFLTPVFYYVIVQVVESPSGFHGAAAEEVRNPQSPGQTNQALVQSAHWSHPHFAASRQ